MTDPAAGRTHVRVPIVRLDRWVENFTTRHGETALALDAGALSGTAADGSSFRALPPFADDYAGLATLDGFAAACAPPEDWGVLLVRKGGFGIARLHGAVIAESKTGKRHVQGKTKAGGQSQQRFARRRDNQARAAYEAAAEHAERLLRGIGVLVVGGDRSAIDQVLAELGRAVPDPVAEFLPVPDPRRDVLESAVATACSARIEIVNA